MPLFVLGWPRFIPLASKHLGRKAAMKLAETGGNCVAPPPLDIRGDYIYIKAVETVGAVEIVGTVETVENMVQSVF